MSKRPASSLESREGPGHADARSKRACRENVSQEAAAPVGEKLAPGIAIPSLVAVTPWISSEISSDLPTLPRILDSELEEAAFTHPGLGHGQNYERLEWLGDAYLELIASSLIYQTFGRTTSGRCSQLREILIRNTTLAQYFRRYDMQLRARLPVELFKTGGMGRGRSRDKDQLKIQGDIFEAYVAAVIVSDPQDGLANVAHWLKSLWGQTIKEQILENERRLQGLQPSTLGAAQLAPGTGAVSAKEKLRAMIGAKGVFVRYEDMPSNSKDKDLGLRLYTVGAYLDGWGEKNKLLGTGTALNKKEAGHKAATMAMENKKLMKVYVAKKEAFQAALQEAASTAEPWNESGPAG